MRKIQRITGEKNRKINAFVRMSAGENLLMTFMTVITTVFMGQIGSRELAGVSIASTLIKVFQNLAMSLGLGATVGISLHSAKRKEIVFQILVLGIFYCIIGIGVILLWMPDLLKLLFASAEPAVRKIAIRYLLLFCPSFPFMVCDLLLSACLRGIKEERFPFLVTLAGNGLNTVLCLLFLFVLKTGYPGGMYAYLISEIVVAAVKMVKILQRKSSLCFFGHYSLQKESIRKILSVSLPSMAEQFVIQNGFVGMQVVTALLGSAILAGYQVVNQILNLIYAVTKGIETTEVTFVSHYAARGDKEDARECAYGLTRKTVWWMLAVTAGLFLAADGVCRLFAKDTAAVREASRLLRLMCLTIPFTTYFQCIQGALKTCNDIYFVAVVNAVCTWGIKIPVSYVLIRYGKLGAFGLVIGFLADYVLRAVFFFGRARKENWLK